MSPRSYSSVVCVALLGCAPGADVNSSAASGVMPTGDMTTSGATTGGTFGNGGSGAAGGQGTVAGDSTTTAGGATSASVVGSSSGSTDAGMGGGSSSGGTTLSGGAAGTTGGAGATGGNGGDSAMGGTGGNGSTVDSAMGGTGGNGSEGDSKFLVFLLIGQSNMEGAPQPEPQDREEDPRIKVLAYDNCPSLGRTYDEWYTASPPLHSCDGGVGPGDYFAKTLIDGLPEGYTIGLVPLGVNGAPIDVFRKDVPRPGWYLPPDDHWETGFEWIVSRAQKAQEQGVIRGILFHQGESDAGDEEWVGKVAGLVADLRTDLGLGNAPFLAGEVYRDGAAADHNVLVNRLPNEIDDAYVISSSGLTGIDEYHFDLESQRELGRRYAEKTLELLAPSLNP